MIYSCVIWEIGTILKCNYAHKQAYISKQEYIFNILNYIIYTWRRQNLILIKNEIVIISKLFIPLMRVLKIVCYILKGRNKFN